MGRDPRVVPVQLTDALLALRRGDLTLDQFKGATSPEAVQRWLAATQLPGTLGATLALPKSFLPPHASAATLP